MKRIICALVISMLLMLPASAGTKEFMEKCLNSWIGYTVDDIIAVLGYPTEEKNIAGKHLLYWRYNSAAYVPQTSYSNIQKTAYNTFTVNTNSYGGYNEELTCNAIIEIDDNNKIIRGNWNGNYCPGSYLTGKKYVNPQNDPWVAQKLLKQQIKAQKKQAKKKIK